jgi:hypothetical protein
MCRRSRADEHGAGKHTRANQTNGQGARWLRRAQRRHFPRVTLDFGNFSGIAHRRPRCTVLLANRYWADRYNCWQMGNARSANRRSGRLVR